MKYYVIAEKETNMGMENIRHLFGPWTEIEKADEKIAELEYDPLYSEVELARVLEDEDSTDWIGHETHEEEEEIDVHQEA